MKQNSGSVSILVLWVGLTFGIILGGLTLFGAVEYTSTVRTSAGKEALMLAEAGVQYYRWHLAHDPNDFADGTGALGGEYTHDYTDPQGGLLGTFTLRIEPPTPGSQLTTIYSTGRPTSSPVERTIKVLFGQPSYAQYSFLNNATSWFGSGLTVYGKVMSNGGVRQDGVNTSTIQSAKETYTCGSETGCAPATPRPGVWGTGGPSELWEFPVPAVDFAGIGVDFTQMKTFAQEDNTYFGPSGAQGYHFVFLDTGMVEVYRVTNTTWRRGYSEENGCERLYQRVTSETLLGTYSLEDHQLFLAEDTVWVEGIVEGRVTLVAARFPLDSYQTNIWIRDNLVYNEKDGSDSLGLIADNDIYFVLDLPQIFEVNGALLAQSGKIYRHFYGDSCGNYGSSVRDELIIFGSVISNNRSAWNWGNGPSSGFTTRTITYDGNLYLSPPPYFPTTQSYEVISWEEVENP